MGQRTIERKAARRQYDRFSREWRDHKRATDTYGKPKSAKKPRFSLWYHVHERDVGQMRQSTATDYLDFLRAATEGGVDPWTEPGSEAQASSEGDSDGERGVTVIPMAGGDEE